ncbi:imidazole glycerol phosphate synthase subunit HisH [Bacillus sp. V3-13]|uniref:imidazole glycerol phosphate synthase subunit HisH n=1 Tax=Bacillus sp. V3-13 TaxID=2053728 RepID=UPI000C761C58|nr:imidazole glycerol phosphate synthase subunit HisH [Bacillus sp. V3-13]PLR76027.1 imidazole glycerol phosphate synthase subunit HisH [Bacillus sp. V3-13]
MIAILDYGVGNVSSILNMFKKIGVPAIITNEIAEVEKAEKLILPGVGSFDSGMDKLNKSGLAEAIRKHTIAEQKPLLGICLGMQMLGRKSEEGTSEGLSLIPFENKRFDFNWNKSVKVPHMGWDITENMMKDDPLLHGLDSMQRYYFVHSYHAVCDSEENVLMKCNYGYSFAASVKKGNIYGVQFHPEKSHNFGMALLENFARRI